MKFRLQYPPPTPLEAKASPPLYELTSPATLARTHLRSNVDLVSQSVTLSDFHYFSDVDIGLQFNLIAANKVCTFDETTCSLSECTRNLFILKTVLGSVLYLLDTVGFRNNAYFARRGGKGCR